MNCFGRDWWNLCVHVSFSTHQSSSCPCHCMFVCSAEVTHSWTSEHSHQSWGSVSLVIQLFGNYVLLQISNWSHGHVCVRKGSWVTEHSMENGVLRKPLARLTSEQSEQWTENPFDGWKEISMWQFHTHIDKRAIVLLCLIKNTGLLIWSLILCLSLQKQLCFLPDPNHIFNFGSLGCQLPRCSPSQHLIRGNPESMCL